MVALIAFSGRAQDTLVQPFRFEEEQKMSDMSFNIISLQKEGLALVRDNEKYENGKKVWELTILDSTLRKVESRNLVQSSRNNFIGYEYAPGHLYLLFRNGDVASNDMHLWDYSLTTQEMNLFEIKHNFELRLTHFSMVGSNAVFGGYLAKEPAVVLYSLEDKQLKVVPGFFLHDIELLDLRVNHNNTFNVLLIERGLKGKKRLMIRTFDDVGTQLLEDIIPINEDVTLLSGITSALVRDELMIIGTYANGNSRVATGFYSVAVDPFSEQAIRFTGFTQLSHFLDYMGEGKSSKVKENAQRQQQKGKDPSFKSNVALVRLKETSKGFLLLAESYSANTNSPSPYAPYYSNPGSYSSSAFSPYAFNNRSYAPPYSYSTTQQNSEVKMLSSVLVQFNDAGEPVWDESLEMDLKLTALEQSSDFIESQRGITIAYKNKSELLSKYMPEEKAASLDTTKIRLLYDSDKVRDEHERDNGVRYWYQNYFYTWGYQSIKSKGPDDHPGRNVFYINKIGVE